MSMEMIRCGGAQADIFFEYLQFGEVLNLGYHLVIVIVRGNDNNAETDVEWLSAVLFEIHETVKSCVATCVLCNIGKGESPTNHQR